MVRTVGRKADSPPPKDVARWLFENQTGLSFTLITLLFLTHIFIPQLRPHTSKFWMLSYYNSNTGKYSIGYDDFYFIGFCIVLFIGLRASSMQYILAPLARHWGVSRRKEVTRFSEQGWMLLYYSVFWPLGMYIYFKSPYFLHVQELWADWPQRDMDGLMKGYMLAQWSVWTQQILVVSIEARRKDYWQMIAHHFVTITLIATSYAYHHTRAGNLILVLMDIVEFMFPLAKCLKYLGFTTVCDVIFGLFIVIWLLSRHVFYLMVCWSVYFDAPRMMQKACYRGTAEKLQGPLPVPDGWSHWLEPFHDASGMICFDSRIIMVSFLSYLLGLQAIIILWSVFIIRVAVRVLQGHGAEDVRSDDEGEEQEDGFAAYKEVHPFEEEVGVDGIDFKGWERRTGVKRATGSSGISLPGHTDQKQLLNRIGCEKQID